MTDTTPTPGMTPDAKRQLSTTIRALRARLLTDLHDETESVYRLAVRTRDAGLDERARARRGRLEAWMKDQVRAQPEAQGKGKTKRTEDDFRREAEKQAAYTLLNRLVILRLMEAPSRDGQPMRKPAVLTGGWESRAYKDFRQLAPALVRGDDTEGYAFLLQLVFEDLATDLPGVFGSAGVADLIPIPAGTLRHVVEELDKDELKSCWTDDMTLGWVYQYWNDPEREALDAKLNDGGKIEPHEIASKTQMFTERYMVDWLLQNSLGPMWLAMCKKHGWAAEVEADGTLERLEARRVEWRGKRERGEVSLTELMPLQGEAERRWAYYVPQPIPEDAVGKAPASARDLKVLDPAVGSGHFLVVAMDLLVALYREEARHRGEAGESKWSDTAIVERILSENLHGIDLDPRAVQIAAAALWLKAKAIAGDPKPERMNLVASNLRLSSLPKKDPALVELREGVEKQTGIPGELTERIVEALRGADYLGSLLKVDAEVDAAIAEHEQELGRLEPAQGSLLDGFPAQQKRIAIGKEEAKSTILDRLEKFLARHSGGEDLGLRLWGQQLAAGVRFVRMVREGAYDLVVANPPYQGTSKMAASKYVEATYPLGKADLYAAFLLRGLELVRDGGVSAMLTMRNWMFIKQYAGLRERLLEDYDLRGLGDFDRGAFEDVPDEVVSVAVSLFRRGTRNVNSVAQCPTDRDDRSRDSLRTARKRAATLCQAGRHEFDPAALKVVPEWPLVYWWDEQMLRDFASAPKIGEVFSVRQGLCTGNNDRMLRSAWEAPQRTIPLSAGRRDLGSSDTWMPFMKGGEGQRWFEPLSWVVNWRRMGLEIRIGGEANTLAARPQNEAYYTVRGVAIQTLGGAFAGRIHRYASVFGDMARSVFGEGLESIVVLLNATNISRIAESLNPTVHFTVGDLKRIPFAPDQHARELVDHLDAAFTSHEAAREPSVEFRHPGPSPWRHAQAWAQVAVDRPENTPLPQYIEQLDPEPPTDHISYALGVALGRFSPNHEGILDPATADLSHALPAGILFLDGTLDPSDQRDGLGHPAAAPLHTAWSTHSSSIDTKRTHLRDYLAVDFFPNVHRQMYENRPIHWPLSSTSRTFVAWVNIHRFIAQTLRTLLADHLHPTLRRIEGELTDLRAARDGADKKAARAAEKRYATVVKARDELQAFIAAVEQCADKGPPPPDPKTPPRDADARYDPDLDDGVMINSAALWPLLDPQWNAPKTWWKELATAAGKKDYDWSHLAMRYWPDRVDKKCQTDPSLGVAHGCFWKYHPARAWSWELRLQDEIAPDFRIEENPYRGDGGDREHRAAYLRDHPTEALAAIEKEALRRRGRGKDAKPIAELRILEPGLWSTMPQDCWDLELRISEKQGAEFHLRAPDEPDARTSFAEANPQRVTTRQELVNTLVCGSLFEVCGSGSSESPHEE